ncbi:MAG: peptidase M56, partial [Betaproteobacteria bacterium]
MNAIDTLGWALVHSLWQDALAAAGLASLLTLVPARAARVRYALAALTLAVMLTLPLATALRLDAASDAAMPALAAPALTSLVDRISAGLE